MDVRATHVSSDANELNVDLVDGRRVSVSLAWYPRLLHANARQRRNWELIGDGEGIRWPDLDEDLSVEGLLARADRVSGLAMTTFKLGDRVLVDVRHHWAQGAAGTIAAPPDNVLRMSAGWSGHVREVRGNNGMIRFHWVSFDDPQRDSDGDGPYGAAEIETTFLTRVQQDA